MAAAGSLALAHDALLPRAPGGLGTGAALALVVHVGLLMALTTAVDWRTETPPPVSAELWASVPQSAPPKADVQAPPPLPVLPTPAPPPPAAAPAPAPAPTPPPAAPLAKAPEPDIAIEKAAREKAAKADLAKKKLAADALAERERAAAEKLKRDDALKAEKAQAEKTQADKLKAAKVQADKLKADREEKAAADKAAREAAAEDARLAQQREENLKRMMGQAGGATGRGGNAAQEAAPSAAYAGRVAARIRSQLVFTGTVPESAETEVLVTATPSGTIMNPRITKSSGHKDWDEAVLRAIDKTGTLPRDVDGRVPREMTLVFSRRDR